SGFSRQLLNALFSLATPLGVALFYLGANHIAASNVTFLGCALAFSAGTFLCIALSDLLPELQFHAHDRLKLSVALLAGIGLMAAAGLCEHNPGQQAPLHPNGGPDARAVDRFPLTPALVALPLMATRP